MLRYIECTRCPYDVFISSTCSLKTVDSYHVDMTEKHVDETGMFANLSMSQLLTTGLCCRSRRVPRSPAFVQETVLVSSVATARLGIILLPQSASAFNYDISCA
jgi:hypothetical protein